MKCNLSISIGGTITGRNLIITGTRADNSTGNATVVWNASLAILQAAYNQIYGAGNVIVSGTLASHSVRFIGFGYRNGTSAVAGMNISGLNGANSPTITRTMTASVSTETDYQYDTQGRLWKAIGKKVAGNSNTLTLTTEYAYDAVGNLDTVTQPNGVYTDYDYDGLNRLNHETVWKSNGGNKLFEQTYTLLDNGQRDYVIEKRFDGNGTGNSNVFSNVKVDWTYDALNRLTGETWDADTTPGNGSDNFGTQNAGDYIDTYSFDLNGNRITKVHDADGSSTTNDETTTSSYDARDRLSSTSSTISANSATYGYDANGSTTSVTTNGATKRYFWDLRNRMVGYSANDDSDYSDAGDVAYGYDDQGHRISKTLVGTGTTYNVIDDQNPTGYSKAIEEKTLTTGSPVRSYIFGLDVIAQSDSTNGSIYLLKDGHGTTRAVTNSSGVVISNTAYDYDAFGNALNFSAGSAITTWLAPDGTYDAETGFTSQGIRVTNRPIGRFMSQDVIVPGAGALSDPNLYLYVNSNPINAIDPTGMFLIDEQMLTMGIRMSLFAMNIYGAYSNGTTAARHTVNAISQFRQGHFLATAAYAASAVFHGGMAALNLLGIKSFISGPPSFSGGLSFAPSPSGGIELFWREIAVRNPELVKWAAKEIVPALLTVFASQLSMFDEPPGRTPSGKTTGNLDTGDNYVELKSGENGPARQFWGQSGFDYFARTHVEGHAAAYMRLKNIAYAVLRINKEEVCPRCQQNLPYMLGPGRTLTVIDGQGNTQTFVGE